MKDLTTLISYKSKDEQALLCGLIELQKFNKNVPKKEALTIGDLIDDIAHKYVLYNFNLIYSSEFTQLKPWEKVFKLTDITMTWGLTLNENLVYPI